MQHAAFNQPLPLPLPPRHRLCGTHRMTYPTPQKTCPKRQSRKIDDVTVSYVAQTAASTTPLICIHGFGASSFSFTPLFNSLPSQTLLAYDAPAFGFTQRPPSTNYYTPSFSATIARFLTREYDTPYAVLAHSMGALAAARLENVHSLIFIAPALLPRTIRTGLARPLSLFSASLAGISALALTLLSPLLAPLLTITVKRKSFWKAALAFSRHPSHPPTEAVIEGYRAPLQLPGWEKALLRFCVAALSDRVRALKEAEDFVSVLAERKCRILIIHGEDDAVVPLDNSVRLAELLNARLVVMKNCGHVPHEEQPELVARHITQFLR